MPWTTGARPAATSCARSTTASARSTAPASEPGATVTATTPATTTAPPAEEAGGAAAPRHPRRWRIKLRRDRSLLIMTAPAVVLLAVFAYAPMFGLYTAFQDYDIYNGFWYSEFVGTYNFERLLNDTIFWHALENTLVISAV